MSATTTTTENTCKTSGCSKVIKSPYQYCYNCNQIRYENMDPCITCGKTKVQKNSPYGKKCYDCRYGKKCENCGKGIKTTSKFSTCFGCAKRE